MEPSMIACHDEKIRSILRRHWRQEDFTLVLLTGDASTRKYYRSKCGRNTLVVMDRGEGYDSGDDPFVRITHYLKSHRLPVPDILADYASDGILLLEDLGDATLQSEYSASAASTLTFLYRQVMQILVKMHTECHDNGSGPKSAFSQRFDYQKLQWELDFFLTHFVADYRRMSLSTVESITLRKGFDFICRTLDAEPVVFTHRDFHSRNLMVRNQQVFMIDYQDARLGPPEYDLASLLRDAYVRLPEDFIRDCLNNYYDACHDSREPCRRRWIFSIMCLQRNMKAAGTFGYQAAVRQNPFYLKFMDTLKMHIETELSAVECASGPGIPRFPDLDAFRKIIGYVLK